jgi:hypothetical protein
LASSLSRRSRIGDPDHGGGRHSLAAQPLYELEEPDPDDACGDAENAQPLGYLLRAADVLVSDEELRLLPDRHHELDGELKALLLKVGADQDLDARLDRRSRTGWRHLRVR